MLNNKKFPALLAAVLFAAFSLTGCNDGENAVEEKVTKDSSATVPVPRDTSTIDTTANPRPLRPGN